MIPVKKRFLNLSIGGLFSTRVLICLMMSASCITVLGLQSPAFADDQTPFAQSVWAVVHNGTAADLGLNDFRKAADLAKAQGQLEQSVVANANGSQSALLTLIANYKLVASEYLLNLGADINSMNSAGMSVYSAAVNTYPSLVWDQDHGKQGPIADNYIRFVRDHGANPNLCRKDGAPPYNAFTTAISLAGNFNDASTGLMIVRILAVMLEKMDSNAKTIVINQKDCSGQTLLEAAVSSELRPSGPYPITEYLLQQGAAVTSKAKDTVQYFPALLKLLKQQG